MPLSAIQKNIRIEIKLTIILLYHLIVYANTPIKQFLDGFRVIYAYPLIPQDEPHEFFMIMEVVV